MKSMVHGPSLIHALWIWHRYSERCRGFLSPPCFELQTFFTVQSFGSFMVNPEPFPSEHFMHLAIAPSTMFCSQFPQSCPDQLIVVCFDLVMP